MRHRNTLQVHTVALRNLCLHSLRHVGRSSTNGRQKPNEPLRLRISLNVVSVYNIRTLDRNHGYEPRTGQFIIIIVCLD